MDKITECWLAETEGITQGKIKWSWLDKQEYYSFLIGLARST